MAEVEREKAHTPTQVVPPHWLRPTEFEEWLTQPDPPTNWIVRGLCPAEALVMLSGPRKRAYKTFFAFYVALLAVYGASSNGWTAETPSNVLILEEESTSAANKARFRNLREGLKLKGAPKARLLFQLRSRFKFDNPRMVNDLISFIKLNDIKLVIFDALTYMISGDPKSTKDMTVVASGIQDIRAATGASLMWLAHTNKAGESEDRDPDLDVRDSSVLLDIYDAHIAVRRKKKRKLTTTLRFKEFPERVIEMFWNFPPEVTPGEFANGPIWPEVVDVTNGERAVDILDLLRQAGWMPGVFYSAEQFRQATKLSPGAAATVRAQMIQEGKLLPDPKGKGVALKKENT